MRRKKGWLMITGGVLLIAAALFLVVYNMWQDQRAEEISETAVGELKARMAIVEDAEPGDDENVSAYGDESLIPDYIVTPMMEMPTEIIDGIAYIGYLSIPSLGLELPVISEWSEAYLQMAPCRYAGSVYMENMVISGHNYRSHFAYISNLQPGDILYYTDVDGNVFTYEVASMEVLGEKDVEAMIDAGWALSLFTCDYTGQNRITIRCEMVK